ncbi:hypothetical protein [Paenibacillus antarcticus]|uniref:Uncharacterized protein n=1 Tax=Paenibacillus antarcticus TaxID=253703 RepID=A0A162MBU0_9BACL|nr:hypothetical protein [Paenibacillus antarcticus]OAB41793.1 hypothetical protein PBAT_20625 [Paenibacillus antarcticus]
MDFSQIYEMSRVIDYITGGRNKNLARFAYRVSVYKDDKDRSIGKKPEQRLSFGNLNQDEFSCDYVDITIYRDKVNLHPVFEGARNYTDGIDCNKVMSLEDKIMFAFNKWSSYYD